MRSIPFPALFHSILILDITYNTSDFSPEQTRLQHAGSPGEEFVSCNKMFVEKIDTNLVLRCTFLQQMFSDEHLINCFITIILFLKILMPCGPRLHSVMKSRDDWSEFPQLFNSMWEQELNVII